MAAGTARGEGYHHSRGAVCTAEGDSGTRDPFTGIPEGVKGGRGGEGVEGIVEGGVGEEGERKGEKEEVLHAVLID